MTIGIIVGSIRKGRLGSAVGQWLVEQTAGREADYKLIELADYNLPFGDSETLPLMANKQYDDANVQKFSDVIDACDGFIFVTPEYNHSVPGPFKNAFDLLATEWQHKPVAFVGYGGNEGVRAVEAWRLVVAIYEMVQLGAQLGFSIYTDFTEGALTPNERKVASADALLTQLEGLVAAH
ncbi:NADPH-dependent FMN reductase [Corynebacterium uterequi]|uniref:Putative flavoprotein n=1 Tax=Corynebacterium uterequi TaxID=1072256 RepID=A0A0G3HBS0_9CORY|nr:NAD(P)H-dependent oxidoreductase [Corynebacterium uterequi]AKK10744.1 putative flavoprotein [Corynebacterium uterequi]